MTTEENPSQEPVPLKNNAPDGGLDIFQQLSGALNIKKKEENRDEDFDLVDDPIERKLGIAKRVMAGIFALCLLVIGGMYLDLYLRFDSTDAGLLRMMPSCQYLISGVDDYQNTECLNTPMLLQALKTKKATLEQDIGKKLLIYLPTVLPTIGIENSPEVQFITSKTINRVPLENMLDKLYALKNDTDLKGEDIDCLGFKYSDRDKTLRFGCTVYGSAILGPSRESPMSARAKAFQFLDRLQSDDSGFSVLNYPTSLSISAYKSSEPGLKSLFETNTKLSLELRYTPPSSEDDRQKQDL